MGRELTVFLLTRRDSSPLPVDVTGILPEATAKLSTSEVAKLPVLFGNERVALGEIFDVSSNTTCGITADLGFGGDTRNVHHIGYRLTAGLIVCENSVGRHAGAQMSGGRLEIIHSSGDWLGAEMRGGSIHVRGDAGDCVGAAYRGSRRGMSGGQIEILGRAGHELGLLLRRGMIFVHHESGEFTGANMIAGTIVIGGNLGKRAGAGMKRGTILAMGGIEEISPGMRASCNFSSPWLSLLGKSLNLSLPEVVNYYRGDVLTGGLGELLVGGG